MENINKQTSSYQNLLYACPYCKNVVKLNICTSRTIQVIESPNTPERDVLNELKFWDVPDLRCRRCWDRMIPLDEHIAPAVLKLWSFGVCTYSSCEGHIGKRSFAKFDKEDYDYPIHSNRGYVHMEGIAAPYVDIKKSFNMVREYAGIEDFRFHDLRHTFATMALENGIDVKTLAAILGHNTVETSLDTYTHITNEMQNHSAITIDKKIAGINHVEEKTGLQVNRDFTPNERKRRRSGKGYTKQLSQNCWQGRYSPIVNGKREVYNIYARTEEECEEKLALLIKEKRIQ